MQFEMWSFWHYLYIVSPFIVLFVLYHALKGRSDRTRHIVGIVLGVLSFAMIAMRNIDLFVRSGLGTQVLPLQLCHLGNIIVAIALIWKNKTCIIFGFCLNMIPAYSSLIFADSLASKSTIFSINAQAYIWGHLFIVVGAIYCAMFYKVTVTKKDFIRAIGLAFGFTLLVIVLNPFLRNVVGWTSTNYFYLFNASGVPFGFIYDLGVMCTYGWFEINWVYTLTLVAIFTAAFFGLYYLLKGILENNAAVQYEKKHSKEKVLA